jgi:FHA domain
MPTCRICGESMPAGARTCTLCGSALPETVPTAEVGPAPVASRKARVSPSLPPGNRFCPSCDITYDVDYTDVFCICGTELQGSAPAKPEPKVRAPVEMPSPGTRCLVIYGDDRQPVHYFELAKDVTLIGRLDAPGGNFPDIDLDEWLDAPTARRISRQHALILRSRSSGTVSLRPLPGNTGTQIETEMVLPMHDYPLIVGQRIILGGVARFKFEIT